MLYRIYHKVACYNIVYCYENRMESTIRFSNIQQ